MGPRFKMSQEPSGAELDRIAELIKALNERGSPNLDGEPDEPPAVET